MPIRYTQEIDIVDGGVVVDLDGDGDVNLVGLLRRRLSTVTKANRQRG